MDAQTITHARPTNKSALDIECQLRALRSCLWLSLFHSQQLRAVGFEARLMPMVGEVDRLLAELDLL